NAIIHGDNTRNVYGSAGAQAIVEVIGRQFQVILVGGKFTDRMRIGIADVGYRYRILRADRQSVEQEQNDDAKPFHIALRFQYYVIGAVAEEFPALAGRNGHRVFFSGVVDLVTAVCLNGEVSRANI